MSVWQLHKNDEPKEFLIGAYYMALEKYSIEDIERAFGYAMIGLKWFPKPVELIEFIKYGEGGAGNLEDIAMVQATAVINAIRGVGFYKSVVFDDPVTMAVVEQGWGGWMKICDLRVDDQKWFIKDFIKIYKAYSNQGIKKYGHLIGYHEDNNLSHWPEKVEPPVLIGDKIKATGVLENKATGNRALKVV